MQKKYLLAFQGHAGEKEDRLRAVKKWMIFNDLLPFMKEQLKAHDLCDT